MHIMYIENVRRRYKMNYKKKALVYKAIGDENRVHILDFLSEGEKCASSILSELSVSQPTLSHHMKILCDAGLVEDRRDGKWTYYRLSEKGTEKAVSSLKKIFSED